MMTRLLNTLLYTSFIAFTFSLPCAADENFEQLKKDNAQLQQEVSKLKAERDQLKAEITRLRADMASADADHVERAKDGTLLGVLWEFDILNTDGTVLSTHKFYAAHGRIFFDWREVGSYVERGSRVRIDVTKAVDEGAIGVAQLERISNKPLIYLGRFTNKRGMSPRIRLRVIEN